MLPVSSTGIFVSDGSSSGRISAQAQSLAVGVAGSSITVGMVCRHRVDGIGTRFDVDRILMNEELMIDHVGTALFILNERTK